MIKLILAAATSVLAAGAQAHATTNLIQNHSFETGDFTGWTVGGDGLYASVFGGPFGAVGGAEDGGYYVVDGEVGFDDTISQTFTDVVGKVYDVSGWVASDGGSPSDFSLTAGGVLFGSANPVSNQGWTEYTGTFVGSGFDALVITDRNDPNFNYFDNFSVSAALPEPATWAMMILGFLGLGSVLRGVPRKPRAQVAV